MSGSRSGVFAVAVLAASSMLAGCGSTKTVTIKTPPPKTTSVAPKTVKQTPTSSTRICSAGVTVNAHASCPFAESILAAYAKATPEKNVTLGIESPETHQNYYVTCSTGEPQGIVCHTTNAVVTFSSGAVSKARARNPSSPSFTSVTCLHGIVAFATNCAFASHVATAYIKETGGNIESSRELSVDGQDVLCKEGSANAEVICSDHTGASIGFSVFTGENGTELGPPRNR